MQIALCQSLSISAPQLSSLNVVAFALLLFSLPCPSAAEPPILLFVCIQPTNSMQSLHQPRPAALGRGLVFPARQPGLLRLPAHPQQHRQQQQQHLLLHRSQARDDVQQVVVHAQEPEPSSQKQQQQPHSSKQPQQPDPQQRRGPLRWLKRNVSRLPFFAKAEEGQQPRFDVRALLQQLRVCILGCMLGCVLLVVRYSLLHQARTAPREVLYSDFVTLLDSGKVKAARLEAASSKLTFELHPQEAAAAAAAAAGASSSSSSSSKAGSSKGKGAAAATAAAAAESATVAAPAKPAPSRRWYIKLADKQDPLLIGKVLTAGKVGPHTHTRSSSSSCLNSMHACGQAHIHAVRCSHCLQVCPLAAATQCAAALVANCCPVWCVLLSAAQVLSLRSCAPPSSSSCSRCC
jgi:hypothetical protein